MSASPSATLVPSSKRPLDDDSSLSGPTDQPDAKRPALDKASKQENADVVAANDDVKDTVDEVESHAEAKDETKEKPFANGHAESNGDTLVPDAPNGSAPSAAAVLETQPIQSTAGQGDRAVSQGATQHQAHQDETGWIHVRAVISSAEAATVIGKGGENVSQIRKLSGAKCTVSDYARGAVERILTVSGLVDATAKVGEFLVSKLC